MHREKEKEKEIQASDVQKQRHHQTPLSMAVNRNLPVIVRLHFNNLAHPHSTVYTKYIADTYALFSKAYSSIVSYLYTLPEKGSRSAFKPKFPFSSPTIPNVNSLTLVIDDTKGVAYTIGIGKDGMDKEIHFSLDYLRHCSTLCDPAYEIGGVVIHELVHCYQHTRPPSIITTTTTTTTTTTGGGGNAATTTSSPPNGLIEGIADYVRLRASYAPPHWRRPTSSDSVPDQWDAGYQFTAYFLHWLDEFRLGHGIVAALNHLLYTKGYTSEKDFWMSLCGIEVGELWLEYKMWLDMHNNPAITSPTIATVDWDQTHSDTN
ncbi:hypothetical protein KEM54_003053 [Ascosphaera aggregata]|nr:hypothetical protein KEM54_003053 [Ascosphaera aggregata]